MPRMFVLSALVGLFWVTPQLASADPLVLFFSRSTVAGVQVSGAFTEDFDLNTGPVLTSTASLTVGDVSGSATGYLTSILDPNNSALSGSGGGTTSATAPYPDFVTTYGSGQTTLEFSIDQAYTYSFLSSFATGLAGFSVFEASLYDRADTTFTPIFNYRDESGSTRSSTGTLLPGIYRFSILGRAVAGCGFQSAGDCFDEGLTAFSFDFQLTPETEVPAVPEPASMILLSTGLAGVFAARRRQKRQL